MFFPYHFLANVGHYDNVIQQIRQKNEPDVLEKLGPHKHQPS